MKFLIQTINGKVKHDFSFTLLESINYHNWLRNDNSFEVFLTDGATLPNLIPIGTVEFVSDYLKKYFDINSKPINIPVELIDYQWTGRNVINGTEKDIHGEQFVKSNDTIKSFTEICDNAPVGNYQISDLIDIESEWRVFVYKGEVVGLQNYSGEFDIFPDVDKINKMVKAYITQPPAYTLDVGICDKQTIVIEVHDFFSCGLYGFAEHKILPFMFSSCFNNLIKKL